MREVTPMANKKKTYEEMTPEEREKHEEKTTLGTPFAPWVDGQPAPEKEEKTNDGA